MSEGFPTGTVTFLMTDVEDSTPAWEAHQDTMGPVMARHVVLVADAVARHGGMRPVEQGEGDSVVAVFALPSAAVAAALDAQRALVSEPWPAGVSVAVRMAVHTGEAYQRHPGRYDGPAVIRCARVRAAAHGGQVLLSNVANALVADRLPAGASLVAVGTVRVKGQSRPEPVWQLCHRDLRATFPPLRSLAEAVANLPEPFTSFLGRGVELSALDALATDHRCVTLTGVGGCGKTRLALELARRRRPVATGGIWWVELVDAHTDADVLRTVAATIGLEDRSITEPAPAIARLFAPGDGPVLLVLDNCEHVLDGAASAVRALLELASIHRWPGCEVMRVSA